MTAAGLVAALAAPVTGSVAEAEPKPTVAEVHARVEKLYHRAEVATDAYNAAQEKVREQRKAAAELGRTAERTQRRLDRLKDEAGALARAQYRGAGVPLEAQVLLSDDPERLVDDLRLARKGQHAQRRLIGEVTGTKKALDKDTARAKDSVERLERSRKAKAGAKEEIQDRLEEAKKLEAKLKAEERERLRRLEEQRAREAQAQWLDSGILDEIDAKATPVGKKALGFATEQLGKDYVWGAEGPDTYDCSGLTMRAWEAAGLRIPRTAETQWGGLQQIGVESMRPGDLIIYHSDASHVGIYAGDGSIIHAPRPGRQVTVTGAGTMPIKGVVRPDA